MSKLYDDALMGVGLNVAQYALLKNLQRLEQPGISSLAEALGLGRSTLGRNLRVLEGKGLVALTAGADQRSRLVVLTTPGKTCLEQASPAWRRVQEQPARRIGPQQKAALLALLDDLETLD